MKLKKDKDKDKIFVKFKYEKFDFHKASKASLITKNNSFLLIFYPYYSLYSNAFHFHIHPNKFCPPNHLHILQQLKNLEKGGEKRK